MLIQIDIEFSIYTDTVPELQYMFIPASIEKNKEKERNLIKYFTQKRFLTFSSIILNFLILIK